VTTGGAARGSAVEYAMASRPGSVRTKSLARAADRSPTGRPTAAGTQRRLQALMARCRSLQAIVRAEGLRAPQLARALEDPALITSTLAADVNAAYDRLWNIEPRGEQRPNATVPALPGRPPAYGAGRRRWPGMTTRSTC